MYAQPSSQHVAPSPDSTAMPSQTLEKPDFIDPVCNACFFWIGCTFVIVGWLAVIWMWCQVPLAFHDINIESSFLGWPIWKIFSTSFCLWLLLASLGLCIELICFVGWLCLRMIRGQQIEGRHYTLLSTRFYWVIDALVGLTTQTYIFVLDTLLRPLQSPRQEPESLYERWRRIGEKLREVETV
ncbi:hypothetical protein F4678DRAFT_262474 [Xylaria arbuscula]|nr:hypothetical protein F4678DRAFT_262474 [Xylaria arbuscula]